MRCATDSPRQRARADAALRTACFKRDNELCEYDLDNEDEDWLVTFNGAQNRLPAERCAARAALASTLRPC